MRKRLLYLFINSRYSQESGYSYLVNNSRAFWSFDGSGAITTVSDLTGNGYNLNVVASPFNHTGVNYFEFRDLNNTTRGILRLVNEGGPMIPSGNSSLLHGDHEFHIVCAGWIFSFISLFGTYNFSSSRNYDAYIDANGKFIFRLSSSVYTSTNKIYRGTGSSLRRYRNKTYFRVVVNFTNDTVRLFVNGGEMPITLTSGSGISSLLPTFYDMFGPFAIGAANNGNSSASQPATYFNDTYACAITDLLSISDSKSVTEYFCGL